MPIVDKAEGKWPDTNNFMERRGLVDATLLLTVMMLFVVPEVEKKMRIQTSALG